MGESRKITLTVNGKRYEEEVEVRVTLADLIRHQLGLTGTYVNNSFQGISRTDNVFVVSAGFTYQVNRNLFLGGTYSFAEQNSTGGPPFTQNILTLRAGTQF